MASNALFSYRNFPGRPFAAGAEDSLLVRALHSGKERRYKSAATASQSQSAMRYSEPHSV